MHGLHSGSHHLVADGSGRDMNIMLDGGWQMGGINGYQKPAQNHPYFQNCKVSRIMADDDEVTDVFGKKSAYGVSLSEAGKRSLRGTNVTPDDWNKASFRMKGGTVVILHKDARGNPSLPANRLQPLVVPLKPKSEATLAMSRSAPAFRSRQTCISFDHWADRYPDSVENVKGKVNSKRIVQKVRPKAGTS